MNVREPEQPRALVSLDRDGHEQKAQKASQYT
jgi:hypothetical protein